MVAKQSLWWLGVLVFLCIPKPGWVAWADSPLTSTPFHRAYLDVPEVRLAIQHKKLTEPLLEFLLRKESSDRKAAVINALGWSLRGQSNGLQYVQALARVHRTTVEQLNVKLLSGQELFVLGYLLAMDKYNQLKAPKPGTTGVLGFSPVALLHFAAIRVPDDFTILLVYGLVRGQDVMGRSFCQVYMSVQKVLEHIVESKRNLRPSAVKIITNYIGAYRSSCRKLLPHEDPKFNMIYRVTRYRQWAVTGTQGGMVFFDVDTGKIALIHPAFIANSFVVSGRHLWAGTYNTLVRFDGTQKKEMLRFKQGRGVDIWQTPQGILVARKGGQYWQYNAKTDNMDPLSRSQRQMLHLSRTGNDYSVTFAPGGPVWSVQFMSAVLRHEGDQTVRYPIGSSGYSGTDPRRVIVSSNGQIWVADFVHGFFFYHPSQDTFVRLPIATSKGSDVAVDPVRKRLWLLHYTEGLYMKDPQHPVRYFNLQHLQYLRSMYLEPNGQTLWIGGWKHLVRMQQNKTGTWEFRSYKVGSGK